jgi:hypothetical protein
MKELSPRTGASGAGSSDAPSETVHDLWGKKKRCGKPRHTIYRNAAIPKVFFCVESVGRLNI